MLGIEHPTRFQRAYLMGCVLLYDNVMAQREQEAADPGAKYLRWASEKKFLGQRPV